MKRKRQLAWILTVCLLFALVGCAANAPAEKPDVQAAAPISSSDEMSSDEMSSDVSQQEQPEESTEQTKEKISLTLAGIDCSEGLLQMIVNEFNKTDSDYRVNLVDYAYGTSAEQGMMKLQTKVLAGNAPDMLLFSSDVISTREADGTYLSPLSFISSGMLLDLDDFVSNDPGLDENDFIIRDALHEFDGMYLLGPIFWVQGLQCTPQNQQRYANWTITDYLTLQDAMQPGQKIIYYMTPECFVENIAGNYIHEAVDVESASCDFNNPTFLSLLEATTQIDSMRTESEHTQSDGSFKTVQEMMLDDEILFASSNLVSASDVGFDRYCSGGVRIWYGDKDENPYADRTGGTTPMGYVGYHTTDGSNGMYVEMPDAVGICSSSKHTDGCWEFIRYMLQNPVYNDFYEGTPLLYSQLENNLLATQKNHENSKWSITQDDQDVVVALAERCEKMSYFDEDILGIIQEEAAELLSGAITAETAAERIQNRASILVMERYG